MRVFVRFEVLVEDSVEGYWTFLFPLSGSMNESYFRSSTPMMEAANSFETLLYVTQITQLYGS
jgi:hypothetical protein